MEKILKFLLGFSKNNEIMYSENKVLIAGLGNMGSEYVNTRHNAGFMAVDMLAKKHNAEFKEVKLGFVAQFKLKNKTIILLKPNTFMNRSGRSVVYHIENEKIDLAKKFIVLYDDIALPLGNLRIRKKGGAGGHNGIQNIIDAVGNSEFARMRIGIGNTFVKGYQSDYVLGQWSEEEKKSLSEVLEKAVLACQCFSLSGVDITMNQHNQKT
jgi:peptidyl-tRNA hydrolase, PTH1 family